MGNMHWAAFFRVLAIAVPVIYLLVRLTARELARVHRAESALLDRRQGSGEQGPEDRRVE